MQTSISEWFKKTVSHFPDLWESVPVCAGGSGRGEGSPENIFRRKINTQSGFFTAIFPAAEHFSRSRQARRDSSGSTYSFFSLPEPAGTAPLITLPDPSDRVRAYLRHVERGSAASAHVRGPRRTRERIKEEKSGRRACINNGIAALAELFINYLAPAAIRDYYRALVARTAIPQGSA